MPGSQGTDEIESRGVDDRAGAGRENPLFDRANRGGQLPVVEDVLDPP